MNDNLSLLVRKLRSELKEYKMLEHYHSKGRCPKRDARCNLSQTIIALTKRTEMDADEDVIAAMLEVDGVLGYCWEIYFSWGVPAKSLFRVLAEMYHKGEVW